MLYICSFCKKSFTNYRSLSGHKRIHGNSSGHIHNPMCCCLITRKEIQAKHLMRYQDSIKSCLYCNTPLSSNRKFCNHSCAASFNNINRVANGYVVTDDHKHKTSKTVIETLIKKGYNTKSKKRHIRSKLPLLETVKTASGPFSKIYFRSCPHCNTWFSSRRQLKYCRKCSPLYDTLYRNRFKFLFNVYNYPDLFDLELINNIGFYSRGGTAGKWNPAGLSRDHKVSVNDAIRNNYDPYYISHPCNCEIMPWDKNNKKKSKSSITYKELKHLVHTYESNKTGSGGLEPPYGFPNTLD